MKRILLASCLSLAACGGGSTPAATEPTPTEQTRPADGEKHEHDFPPAATAFHDRLAPLWHAEAGAERTEKTCAAVPDLQGEAGPMSDGSPVAEDKLADYSAKVGELKGALVALEEACAEEGRPQFDAAFTKVHEAFHGVVAFFGHTEHEGEHGEAGHAHE